MFEKGNSMKVPFFWPAPCPFSKVRQTPISYQFDVTFENFCFITTGPIRARPGCILEQA